MQVLRKIKTFSAREDGSLLVFFVVCIVSILGILALSFDMGRRAATQTDMQSFADNVALAAAGELDGSANAIVNARAAAQNAIIAANEALKAGASGTNATLSFDVTGTDDQLDLVFYSNLPNTDGPGVSATTERFDVDELEAAKYALPTANRTTDPAQARYVGVRLNVVNVDWMFANIFGSANLPDEAVGAVAIAGNAGYTCEIAPLMVCLPRNGSGGHVTLSEGQGIRLQTVGKDAAWNPGQFGYLDINSIPDAMAGPCASETPESRKQACLLARGISACWNDRGVDIQTGQRGGQEPAGFNLPFGIFGQAMNNLSSSSIYNTGPHTISGQEPGNNCNYSDASTDTMPFPPDTCLTNGTDGASTCGGTTPGSRFGNGTWDRATYVDTNYSFTKPNGEEVDGDWFDFPDTTLTRYEYYLLEIERAANGGVMNDAGGGLYTDPKFLEDPNRGSVNAYDSWDDYWDDITNGFNPIIPDAHNRADNGLPQCGGINPSANANRRVVVIAGIDCPPSGEDGHLTGDEDDVPVVQYYRVFLLSPAREVIGSGSEDTGDDTGDTGNNGQGNGGGNNGNNDPIFELFVEVIEPIGGEAGASTSTDTAFREVIQLYR